jgi:hypothetical protein
MATTAQRKKLADLMDIMVAHEPKIHYAQVRPMRTRSIKNTTQLMVALGTGFSMDCSESVTLLCRLAGLKDPNGEGFNGVGNTQDMYNHLQHYQRPASASIGALVFLGIPGELSTQHICMVRHGGKDPILFSHGQEKGPFYIKYSVERQYHQGTPTFLNIGRL